MAASARLELPLFALDPDFSTMCPDSPYRINNTYAGYNATDFRTQLARIFQNGAEFEQGPPPAGAPRWNS